MFSLILLIMIVISALFAFVMTALAISFYDPRYAKKDALFFLIAAYAIPSILSFIYICLYII